ncbi:MAG: hypothetical protein ACK5X3_09690 [Pseudomonadota bacterium]
MTTELTYQEVVDDYYEAASERHEFTRYSAGYDAEYAHEALTAIRACIVENLGRYMERADGACFGRDEINEAVEYATDMIGENLDGPAGLLFRFMNAYIRAETEALAARAKRMAEAN